MHAEREFPDEVYLLKGFSGKGLRSFVKNDPDFWARFGPLFAFKKMEQQRG
jgi:hypothetical protein